MLAAAALTVAAIFSCHAAEPQRRFSVELAILAGDARALQSPELDTARRRGLRERVLGSLSMLPLLARQSMQAQALDPAPVLDEIVALRLEFTAGQLRRFADDAAALSSRHPLNTHGLRPDDASAADRSAGRHIYGSLCMGCHEHPDRARENPAQNLFTMARRLPQREFLARLLGGVHGTPDVALRNPFSDREMAGLAAYLTAGDRR